MLEIKKSTFDLSWMGLSIFAQKYLHKYEDTYQSFHVKPNGAACLRPREARFENF